MASRTLFPPIVDSYMPSFQVMPNTENECNILFSLSKFNSSSEVKEIHISVNKQGTGLNMINSLSNSSTRFRNTGIILVDEVPTVVGDNLYLIKIYDEDLSSEADPYYGWIPGCIYKVQLRLSSEAYSDRGDPDQTQSEWLNEHSNSFSEWSTICIVKPIGDIKITIPTFNFEGTNPTEFTTEDYTSTTLNFVGSFESLQDATEILYSYRTRLYDSSEILIEDSELITTKNYQNINEFKYLFKNELSNNSSYKLVFEYVTNNGYSSTLTLNFDVDVDYDSGINAYVATIENDANKVMWGITTVSKEEDEGRIGLKVFSDTRIDILSETDKNMTNWTIAGGDTPTITYLNEVNSIVYDNIIRTPIETLQYLIGTAAGMPVTTDCANQLLNFWSQHQDLVLHYLRTDGNGSSCLFTNINSYYDETDGFHIHTGDYDLLMYTPGVTSMTGIYITTQWDHDGIYPNRRIIYYRYVCTYSNIINGISYNCNVNKTLTVEDGEIYFLQFKGCSPSGFEASENQITLVSGNNTESITFDNTQTSDYSDYTIRFIADGNSANVNFDLSKIAGYNTTTLNIKDIALYKVSNNYTGTLIIRRSDSKSNFTSWTDIKMIECNQTDIANLGLFYDYTVESGVWYLYALQTLRSGNRSPLLFPMNQGVKMRNPSMRNFEYSFLLGENNQQLKLKFDNTMGSYKIQQMDSKFETVGGVYPFISRNAALNYRIFPVNGLISYMMDDNKLFCNQKVIYTYDDIVSLYKDYENQNRIGYNNNYIYERDFRHLVIKFLTNGKPKLFKSPTEGNVIVRLTDINFTPNQSLDRMIYSFTATGNEIAEDGIPNYIKYKFLDLYTIKAEDEDAGTGHIHNEADTNDSPYPPMNNRIWRN